MNAVAAGLDDLYRTSDDPWGFRTRWYERRKRAILLASLPREHFGSAWEMGCSNGELAAHLAPRCGRLLASDGNPRAISLARERLSSLPNVEVAARWLPDQWPSRSFDLIVMSEFAYFLSRAEFHALVPLLARSLTADGIFAACHWRHPVDCSDLTGDEIHRTLARDLPWTLAVAHEEADFRLDVWTADPRPLAAREGIS